MTVEDIYDARTMLFSLMYILGNKDNIELNIDIENSNNHEKAIADIEYRQQVISDYLDLIKNKQETEDNEYKISLENDKYSVEFNNKDYSSQHIISGIISFTISTN